MKKLRPSHHWWNDPDEQFAAYARHPRNGTGRSHVEEYEPTLGATITTAVTVFLLVMLFLALSLFSAQGSVRRGGQPADYVVPVP